ncbi:MAG: DUF3108 domain-containing protein [Burkholderiales bacterium]|nr:MAG: DUF3108 domain-containing protein [Burkholderiales bacterium]
MSVEPAGVMAALRGRKAPTQWRDDGAPAPCRVAAPVPARRAWLAGALGLAVADMLPVGVLPVGGRRAWAGASSPYGGTLPAPPERVRIRFGVYYGSHVDGFQLAEVSYVFTSDGHRYEASTAGQAVGPIALVYGGVLSQRSSGLVSGDGLTPRRYAEKRGTRAERELLFEPEVGRVRFARGDNGAWVPGVQDRLSFVWQLGLLARGFPEQFAAGSEHRIPLASFSSIEPARIVSEGVERLRDGARELSTLHVVRPPRSRRDEKIELWLDRHAQMRPVRIRITDRNGRVLDHFRLSGER